MKEYHLTKEGLDELLKEREDLINNKRKEIAIRLKEAKNAGGDLTENSEYEFAKTEQAFIEGRIEQISEILSNYIIIEKKTGKGLIELGSVVIEKKIKKNKKLSLR